MARLVFRLPWGAALYLYLLRRAPRLSAGDRGLIIGRQFYADLFRSHPGLHAIIISDVSPDRHMLWSAAAASGRALWWQDDYHYTSPLDHAIQAAAVLNQPGYLCASTAAPSAVIVQRPSPRLKPLRHIPSTPRMGISTNAEFAGAKEQLRLLDELRALLGSNRAYLRLHPNSSLGSADFAPDWLDVAPADEPLSGFAEKVDVVLVGNSAVQLKLLCEGVPVIHVAGLDDDGYDAYGYVASGMTFGEERPAGNLLQRANAYYSLASRHQALADYVTVRPGAGLPGIAGLRSLADARRS